MLRKKNKFKPEESLKIEHPSELSDDESPMNESTDANSIEEFIEIKKLQNRLLEKMIKKINDSENLNKQ